MAVLRILAVSIVAAITACIVASLILFGNVERASFIPLMFALPGSILLLATAYSTLKEQGTPRGWSYAALIGIGALGGGLTLGLISSGNLKNTAIGSFYGVTTALCWIILHALTRKLSSSTRTTSPLT